MFFQYDSRLGIETPDLEITFEHLPHSQQEDILAKWETIRAKIPDQIIKFEEIIQALLDEIHKEDDWDIIAAHFSEIADYASRIAELNSWRRIDPSLHPHPSTETTLEHQAREK